MASFTGLFVNKFDHHNWDFYEHTELALDLHRKKIKQQECIPVGCVPAASTPYAGVCFPGGDRGVSTLGGYQLRGCLLPGGCLLQGMSGLGGVCSGGCLLWGRGVCSQGVSGLGGCLLQGGLLLGGCLLPGGVDIPVCTEADTPPPVDRHTPVKILPWPNFLAAGNKMLPPVNFELTM